MPTGRLALAFGSIKIKEDQNEKHHSPCYLLNSQDLWEPAMNPLNRYSTIWKGLGMQKLNPGYSFSKSIIEKDKDISIGLVVNAKGGSSIKQWSKESKFYKEAVRRIKSALKTGVIKGVLLYFN